jgi:hypothetical protein
MVILSSILKKCQKSTFETNVRYQLISALFCDPGAAAPDTKVGYNTPG